MASMCMEPFIFFILLFDALKFVSILQAHILIPWCGEKIKRPAINSFKNFASEGDSVGEELNDSSLGTYLRGRLKSARYKAFKLKPNGGVLQVRRNEV